MRTIFAFIRLLAFTSLQGCVHAAVSDIANIPINLIVKITNYTITPQD
jgi:hypothetical protein